MKNLMILILLLAGAAFADGLPIPTNPAVTQETIGETICVPGYTKTVRPPVAFTNKIKFALMKKVGIPREDSALIELDHACALTDGCAGDDPRNLRLQLLGSPDDYFAATTKRETDKLRTKFGGETQDFQDEVARREAAGTLGRTWPDGVDYDAKVKDKLEVALNKRICSGDMDLDEAQACIWDDWRACAESLKARP
jgi:hypothetical protein